MPTGAASQPQIMQMQPQTVQQMALVPVSGPNGQTVYQQMPVPMQVCVSVCVIESFTSHAHKNSTTLAHQQSPDFGAPKSIFRLLFS